MRSIWWGGVALMLAALPVAAGAAKADRGKLDQLIAAAEAIDNNAEPARYLTTAQAALVEAQRLYPANSPEIAARQADVAMGLASNSRFDEAIALVTPAVARLEMAGPAWRSAWLKALGTLGFLSNYKGDHARALTVYTTEVDARRAIGREDADLATSINNLAASRWEAGEATDALALNAEAIAIAERLPKPPADLMIWYANRSAYLFTAGRTDEAIRTARVGLARGEALLSPDHPSLSNLLANLAAMLNRQGRPADAQPIARRAFELVEKAAGKPTQNSAVMRVMFAQTLMEQRKYADAEQFLAAAIPVIEGELGRESDRALQARESRALALMNLGRADEARAIQTEVVATRDTRLGTTHRDRMNGRVNLAKIALRQGDVAGARVALEQAVALRVKAVPANHPDLLAERAMLLSVRLRGGDPATAMAADARAILAALIDNARYEPSGVSTNRDRAAFGYVAEVLVAAGDVEPAFTAQQWGARTSVDDAVAAAAGQRAAADPALAAQLAARRQLSVERAQLFGAVQAQIQRPDPDFKLEDAAAKIADVDRRLHDADTALGTAADTGRFAARTIAQARAGLAANDVFAMVSDLGGERLIVTLLTRDRVVQYRPVDAAATIRDRVMRVRTTLDGAGEASFARADAVALYAALFADRGTAMLNDKARLLVAANGSLSALPFAVLMPARNRFLIERIAVERLPGAPHGAGAMVTPARPALVAVGDAAGGAAARTQVAMRSGADARTIAGLPALPETSGELADLARAIGADRPVILTGPDATEAKVRATAVPAGAVVAFATHGLVSGELEGLREPALVLTPADDDDGLLTASEIGRMTIPAAWVILSACNTAAGAGPNAPGLSGLAQAFILAGSDRILATHWPVRDDVARAISVGTMTAAARGAEPAAALRKAILSVRRDHRDPRLWAAFELIGQ